MQQCQVQWIRFVIHGGLRCAILVLINQLNYIIKQGAIMNKTKTNQPINLLNGADNRRPKRCTKCSCVFAYEKYNDHFASCIRPEIRKANFSRNQTRQNANFVMNKNNIRAPPTYQKRQERKSLVYDHQSHFRIKNISSYSQKEKPKQQKRTNIDTEKRIEVESKIQMLQVIRQAQVSIQENKQSTILPQKRQMVDELISQNRMNHQQSILNNIQNYQVIQSDHEPPIEERTLLNNHRNLQQTNNQSQRETLFELNSQTQPNSQPNYDIEALISNSNSIISFIRNINLIGQDATMDSMLAQLEQLNHIANQLSQMSSIGNRIGYSIGNLFAARIHQLQTVITNQIGIALIRGFNERLGSQFELLMLNRPAPQKAGFTEYEIEQLFPEKINYSVKQCPICLQDMKKSDVVLQLQCHHIYHPDCLKQWLLSSKKCPMCRKIQSQR